MTDVAFDTPGTQAKTQPGADDPGYIPGVRLDRGRYMLPVPGEDPSDEVPWTRVTTLTGALTSNEGLRIWTEHELVRGLGRRSDLRAMLAAGGEDKDIRKEVIAAAKEAAGIGASANWGRALHRAVENLTDPTITSTFAPDPAEQFGRDVIAATECLARNGIKVKMVERLVMHQALGYAGRLDALWEVTLPDGRIVLRVGDVKTGDKLDKPYKRMVMAAQEAAYVNADYFYDPATRTFARLPDELDRDTGYILSVRDGEARLYEIDLRTGWTDVLIASKLHRRRRASTDMLPVGRPVRIEAPVSQAPAAASPQQPASTNGASDGFAAGEARVAAMVEAEGGSIGTFTLPDIPDPAPSVADPRLVEFGPADVIMPAAQPQPTAAPRPPVEPERTASGRKRRTCSVCRQPGHIARTCPNKEAVEAGTFNPAASASPAPSAAPPAAPVADPTPTPAPARSTDDLVRAGRSCTCATPSGWSSPPWSGRPDVLVCGDCGLPSAATLAKLAGEQPRLAPEDITEIADKATAALVQAEGPPPWAPPSVSDQLMDKLNGLTTKAELEALWAQVSTSADAGAWTEAHTQRARELLPLLR